MLNGPTLHALNVGKTDETKNDSVLALARLFPVRGVHPANAAALCHRLASWLSFDGHHHRTRISSGRLELRSRLHLRSRTEANAFK